MQFNSVMTVKSIKLHGLIVFSIQNPGSDYMYIYIYYRNVNLISHPYE